MGKAKGPRKGLLQTQELESLLKKLETDLANAGDGMTMPLTPTMPPINIKSFRLDYSKINTLEDIKDVFQAMDMHINWYTEECPEKFKKIYEKGFLKPTTDENI
jgi:hypothetical protein